MEEAPCDPIARFRSLLELARATALPEPTAMALATVNAAGQPSVRMVLLKDVDEQGLVFYTNLGSRKAAELRANPQVALCFHWQPLEAQVRVEGAAQPVSKQEADDYFASRSRGSQLGAWASRQSQPLDSRAELEERLQACTARFQGTPVPRPDFWSGFRVAPARIEFWTGKPNRLHEREVYTRNDTGGWSTERLYP